ncbi:MAG: hypothetical protein B7X59_00525 [Polaromonas sp. 39-63-203]|jgi:ABC-type transport system involved in multi-copper enzyme maturation permease subunit|uniref:hypothetical protein n=1 Tax=Polaromonas sp. TaxID=1869339 RepID=UPI000BCE6654|nr:hypothetical protein [Polaromonas sp.]OYY53716.1 MAG: hypothetical protein B7Y54_01860 [Polaromonas sp. 35-63-240]OYZ03423.1 MAG: hypothetical protein B7Y42_00710 [Polaromonas sp. 28-63-22]OYZ85272.1 MAG: hypothetical protein B7Y03_00300 [Polaromonas sp. 24-62-144]OZB02426.1 MAG: hypothetical protein B7X59_00525 [Polaromonas sp. 39-63-203]HQS31395.1 hypothetical protein [Polaromonas sp.]
MKAMFRYVLLTALRDRLFAVLALLALCLFVATWILGQASLVEREAASIALAAGSLRTLVVLGLVVFICFHVQRLFDSREIEALLARPMGRGAFVLAYWLAGAAVACLLAVIPVAGLLLLQPPSTGGLLLWSGSLLLECLLVVAMALTISLAMDSAVAATLATLAVYTLGREMGFLLAITSGQAGALQATGAVGWLDILLQGVAALVVRLDLFGQSDWLVNGPDAGFGAYWFVAQGVVYTALLLVVATVDLRKRKF